MNYKDLSAEQQRELLAVIRKGPTWAELRELLNEDCAASVAWLCGAATALNFVTVMLLFAFP